MSEESKPIAPAGASSVTACEDCWRPKGGPGGCFAHERNADHYGWTEDCQRATIVRLRIGWERERRRAESAEKELESCRSRLSTAEKEIRDRDATHVMCNRILREEVPALRDLLRRIHGWDHMDTAADGPYWRREIDAALSGSNATDAPKAPQASEIASDSSALEKALGALRAVLDSLEGEGHGEVCSAYSMMQYDMTKCDCFKHHAEIARAVLSGGAHVDGPKAPKEESK